VSGLLLAFSLALFPLQSPAQEKVPPEWLIRNVIRWLPLVERWHSEYPGLDPAWVLAIIAQESQGFPDVIGSDRVGSVGLMQIAPFAWRPSDLSNPSVNIRWGIGILNELLERHPDDLRRVLAIYNCGEAGVQQGLCGRHGGYAYAGVVLRYWVPVFREAIYQVSNGGYSDLTEWMQAFYPERDLLGWLATLGYDQGLGRWEEAEREREEWLIELQWANRFRME